ncbi:MAG: replicative DNA helicase [Oscillospiraceae bacterium]|nr:replicative DNA helicase [Oscillospiraceae bacterium]
MAMDDLLHRQIPHSTEAEHAVLGSMLIDGRCVSDVIGVLKADDFYSRNNRDIFQTMFTMFNFSMPIDPVTVLDKMKEDALYNDDSPGYLRDLMLITPTASNVMEYAAIVKDKALLRSIADAGGDISEMAISGEGGASNILEAAEKRIYALRQDKSRDGLEPVSKVLVSLYEEIRQAAKSGSGIPGLTTGLHDLDKQIMGLNKGDLVLIASRPGMGKTSIALNIALHAAKSSGKSVAVFSLEMSSEQLAMRLLASEAFIDSKKLQTGRIKPEEWRKLSAAAKSISEADLLINDNASLSVADMNAQCRRVPNLGLVVVDYLQLMQSASGGKGGSDNRVQVVSEISRMMKIMAKELNVPLICLSQLSRANESRQNKRPLLSDLRESGAIEQDADIVMALYRDDYYDKETEAQNIAECIVLKNRRGETGTIELQWLAQYTNFSSLERHHTDDI